MASRADGGGILGALGSHYVDALRHWFGEVAVGQRTAPDAASRLMDTATGRVVKAETDDAFVFTLEFADGGVATMIASFAATPARGARIIVMGDAGTLIAEQPGPNPMEDGVVIASRNGSPLADRSRRLRGHAVHGCARPPPDGVPAAGARLHARHREGTSPAPNFTDGWRCQQVLDAVRQSSASGRTITIS